MFTFVFSNSKRVELTFDGRHTLQCQILLYNHLYYILSNSPELRANDLHTFDMGGYDYAAAFAYDHPKDAQHLSHLGTKFSESELMKIFYSFGYNKISKCGTILNSDTDSVNIFADDFMGNTNGKNTAVGDITSPKNKKPFKIMKKFISKKYSQDEIYTNIRGYHYSHDDNWTMNHPIIDTTSHLFGVELEVVAKDTERYEKLIGLKSNYFFMEIDSSLPRRGVEIISIPLLPKDAKNAKFWVPMCDNLSQLAKSWKCSECGLHIHISKAIFGNNEEEIAENEAKVWYLYNYFIRNTPYNIQINGRRVCFNDHDMSTTEGNSVGVLGNEVLKNKEVKDKVKDSLLKKGSELRYCDINISNKNTIEFRKGKGSINAMRIAALCRYYEDMCKYAIKSRWSDLSSENFINYMKSVESKTSPINAFIK